MAASSVPATFRAFSVPASWLRSLNLIRPHQASTVEEGQLAVALQEPVDRELPAEAEVPNIASCQANNREGDNVTHTQRQGEYVTSRFLWKQLAKFRHADDRSSQLNERKHPVIPMILKRTFACAALSACVLGVSGCTTSQPEDNAKEPEAGNLAEKSAEAKALQLQKDLDAARSEIEQTKRLQKNAETTVKTLEQKNIRLSDHVKTLARESNGLKAKLMQLQKALDSAKQEVERAEKAKKAAEAWELTFRKKVRTVRLEALANNRYRLGPQNLAFHGVYQFDGKTLSMVAENAGYPNLVWSMTKPGQFEILEGSYAGASMRRKIVADASAGPHEPKTHAERE
jgi:hypothetical protein